MNQRPYFIYAAFIALLAGCAAPKAELTPNLPSADMHAPEYGTGLTEQQLTSLWQLLLIHWPPKRVMRF